MVGVSEPIARVFQLIDEVAAIRTTVLITGESGTGKDMVARAIHNKSERRDQPFVKLNCAAIPETLLESELFGHERGSFTGAIAQKKGKLEAAHKGTLLLDEVGDLSPASQAKLLRVLQEQTFERVGGTQEIRVDARVLSATNKNLPQEIEARRFRDDLYYRLNVIHIQVPPLRERVEDIPVLAEHFLVQHCEENGVSRKRFSPRAIEYLQGLSWPGNVRELENLVRRAAIMVKAEEIIPSDITELLELGDARLTPRPRTLKAARDEFERDLIRRALAANNGDKTKTAQQLDIERAHLYRKLKSLGISD
jgi:DNA-binding NtrC family response regulator